MASGKDPQSYALYQQIETPQDKVYKVIQLPKDFKEQIEKGKDNIVIKSGDDNRNYTILCTKNKTWKVRQLNHSNTVMLMSDPCHAYVPQKVEPHVKDEEILKNSLFGIANLTYEYELTRTLGYIDNSLLPIYSGKNDIQEGKTVQDLINNSPISEGEFFKNWFCKGGCKINGFAVILSDTFITEVLLVIISILISKGVNYRNESPMVNMNELSQSVAEQGFAYSGEVTETLLNRFGSSSDGGSTFILNNHAIAKWFGIYTLKTILTTLISPEDFLLKWKSALPPFYNVPIDLPYLRGYFCRPVTDRIQFLHPETLPLNLASRISELFKISKEWQYDEFLPFVEPYVPEGKKVESILLKHVRKRRLNNKKFVVFPR